MKLVSLPQLHPRSRVDVFAVVEYACFLYFRSLVQEGEVMSVAALL